MKDSDVEELVTLAIASGLTARRKALLDGLPPGFVWQLPTGRTPEDQLRYDLREIARTHMLIGCEQPPIVVWLNNAAVECALMRRIRAAMAFQRASDQITGARNGVCTLQDILRRAGKQPGRSTEAQPRMGAGLTPETTLEHARTFLEARVGEGIDCPCCGQFARVYWRRFNASMARFLVLLLRAERAGTPWVDIRTVDVRGGDYAKAELWGLCEAMANDNPAKRTSGMWRLTPRGRLFAEGKETIYSHVAVYNGKACGERGDRVDIHATLARGGFHYRELMDT